MAKTDLLKEAIADAKAVKETAIANAKIALEEAFGNRLQSMLGKQLSEQLDDEEVLDTVSDEETVDDMEDMEGMEVEPGMEDMEDMEGMLNIKVDDPATPQNPDWAGDIPAAPVDDMADDELAMTDDELAMTDTEADEEMADAEADALMNAEDDELAEIIRELEEEAYNEGNYEEKDMMEEEMDDEYMTEDIDSIIAEILALGS